MKEVLGAADIERDGKTSVVAFEWESEWESEYVDVLVADV